MYQRPVAFCPVPHHPLASTFALILTIPPSSATPLLPARLPAACVPGTSSSGARCAFGAPMLPLATTGTSSSASIVPDKSGAWDAIVQGEPMRVRLMGMRGGCGRRYLGTSDNSRGNASDELVAADSHGHGFATRDEWRELHRLPWDLPSIALVTHHAAEAWEPREPRRPESCEHTVRYRSSRPSCVYLRTARGAIVSPTLAHSEIGSP